MIRLIARAGMNKQDIIAHITSEIYALESEDAWKAAPFTGSSDVSRFYSSDTPFTISHLIWETQNGLNSRQKADLLFEVYADLPCYTLLSEVYIHQYRHLPQDAQDSYWHYLAGLLSQAEEALAQPVVYTLAVDFFEDRDLCERVWKRLVTPQAPAQLLRRVLEASAAVPFVLKGQLYQQLVADPSWHGAIYKSLLASYYSTYGEIDKLRTRELLRALTLRLENEERTAFEQALERGQRYANYYADRRASECTE
jgi:hypothetical protein